MNETSEPMLLRAVGISKHFGGEAALSDVDFELGAGEVHGIVGSNGAGKSTLMKILAGALREDSGSITIDGRKVELTSPGAALREGIAMVYQELSGVGQLSVAENLFLGRQPTTRLGRVDWRQMRRRAEEYLRDLGIEIDVRRRLDRYPLVVRQMVEIARGLHSGGRILILDEPTSALSPPESRRLFELIALLKDRGVAVVFISHFIEDVLEICDRVTILRDGERLETTAADKLDKHYVIHTMLGHSLEGEEIGYETAVELQPQAERDPQLTGSGMAVPGAFARIDVEVASGECLGLYGFVGAGHQDLAHALAGAVRLARGKLQLEGRPWRVRGVHDAVRRGVVLVAADRGSTLVHGAEVYKNVTLAHLTRTMGRWLTRQRETRRVEPLLRRVGCRPPLPMLKAGSLSGGNQQKVVLAKWLLGPVQVLILDEPTRGMDVGAKDEIMQLVGDLKREGTAVVLASTEPEILLAHADRIMVMRRGQLSRTFAGERVDKATLMRCAS